MIAIISFGQHCTIGKLNNHDGAKMFLETIIQNIVGTYTDEKCSGGLKNTIFPSVMHLVFH